MKEIIKLFISIILCLVLLNLFWQYLIPANTEIAIIYQVPEIEQPEPTESPTIPMGVPK